LNPDDNSRFQKIDKVALLSLCPLFSGLNQWELQSISQLMRLVEYKREETVYKEGGEADSFYVVVSGRFEAFTESLGKKKILAYLRRGDYFGEMSLLTDEPHSATLRALSDVLVLVLKKEDFKKIVEHNAVVALELSRRLSSRLKGMDTRSRSLLKSDLISIFSNQHKIGRTAFSINLAASLFQETHQKTVLLDMSPSGSEISTKLHMAKKVPITQFHNIENEPPDILSRFMVKHPVGFEVLNVAHQKGDTVGENIITALLNHLAIDYRFILIDLSSDIDEMVFKVLSQSDSIFFVTDSNLGNVTETKDTVNEIQKNLSYPEEKIFVVINEVFLGMRTNDKIKKELFGRKKTYSLPATPELKEFEASGASRPFVVEDPEAEYSRTVRYLARLISNNLVGLALGSGAALGLAHIGVLKVLEREKIQIDMISGSSIGALIGSLYTVCKDAATVEQAALEINSRFALTRLLDFSFFPVKGLFNGRLVIKHFKSHLGNKTFEDCRIPLKVIGANLSTRQILVLDSGFISDAVRASIAIPAIFKPVIINGDVIVDGGMMSPLPVRALHQAGANKVIAVNVFPTSKDILEKHLLTEAALEKEALAMRKKNLLLKGFYKTKKWINRLFFPNVFDILMNTIQTMETELSETEGDSADVLLRPVVPNANWVEVFKPQQFIKRGEEETMKMLPKIKALVSQQNV